MDNGCLFFAPGSQRIPLKERFVRVNNFKLKGEDNSSTKFVPVNEVAGPGDVDYVPVEVKAGTLVLINGLTYHKSGPNNSSKSRWIYTFHLIEGKAHYPADNWLQPTRDMPFTKLF